MNRHCVVAVVFFHALVAIAQPQNAVVRHNTYLRAGPSTAQHRILLLKSGDELELVDPDEQAHYYHVRTLNGEEGFAYAGNVTVKVPPETIRTTLATSAGPPATALAPDWEKPAPKKTTLQGPEGPCPWNGDNSAPETFRRKNRADTPEQDGIAYHDVTWRAIASLAFPDAKPLRKQWTPEQLAAIAPFEGIAVRTTGYLVAFKPQSGGSGEGTNCHFSAATDTDTHLALVEDVGDAEKSAIVIEYTPRFLTAHPKWKRATLAPWLNADSPVRISGWLMLDPDHRNHLQRFRSTLWEIHPITRTDVWQDNHWVDTDTLK